MQILIGKTGKGSLKRRVAECSAESISLPVAERASVMLQQFDAITIQDTSLGCATFHAWVRELASYCILIVLYLESRFVIFMCDGLRSRHALCQYKQSTHTFIRMTARRLVLAICST
jgi:hypothetical protein